MIDSQPECDEKTRFSNLIDRLLDTYNNLALIRQNPGMEHFEVAERVLQCNANTICQQLPTTDDLVKMATGISKKALHEFLLTKCKEQTMNYTKKFRLKGNTPMINKLRADLTALVNSGGSSEDILKIEARMKELEEEDIARALKLRKTSVFVRMRGQAKSS